MSDTTYKIENAKSARSACKTCKEKIGKEELRIVKSSTKGDYNMTDNYHPKCFVVPPKALKGVSAADFVDTYLDDATDDLILSDEAKRAEIIADIDLKPPRKSKGKGDGELSAVAKRIAEFKKAAEELDSDSEGEEERPAKKAKKGEGIDLEACARAMKVYGGMNANELKEVLRWNLGYGTTGNKGELLLRVIDGHVNGRLARCPQCFRGKVWLKNEDAGDTVVCKGFYDEDIGITIPCHYKGKTEAAARLQPWYSEEPTEEEIEAMKAITEKHEALAGGGGGGDVPQELLDAAAKLEWPDTDTPQGKKEAARLLVDVCTSGATKLHLPQDEKKAVKAMGQILINNPGASAAEIVKAAFAEFGVAAAKAEAKAQKQSAIAGSCACPANAPVVAVMQELSDLYFKESNANAGGTYKKVVAALVDLDYEITTDNAKGLGKGKTKVANIGKGSADKIHEFLSTGTIQKLEEKRAVNS